jgi:hypothetical protein
MFHCRQLLKQTSDFVRIDVIRPHHFLDQVVEKQRLQTPVWIA